MRGMVCTEKKSRRLKSPRQLRRWKTMKPRKRNKRGKGRLRIEEKERFGRERGRGGGLSGKRILMSMNWERQRRRNEAKTGRGVIAGKERGRGGTLRS